MEELTPEVLEACYRAGAFPMADRFGRIEFYRSDPRSVLEFGDLHVPRSLGRVIRKGTYEVRVDEDFEGVVRACADREDTWINTEIVRAYVRLHEVGKAHSVEAYHEGELAGGLYGIENSLELEPELKGNAYESGRPTVPRTLREARMLFSGSERARAAFGDQVVDHYTNMADVELAAFDSAVTDWELRRSFERM